MPLEKPYVLKCIIGRLLTLMIAFSTLARIGLPMAYAQSGAEVWQWSDLPVVIGGGVLMPEAVALPDGTYRMYFNASGGIWYADSQDATRFTVEAMVLAGTNDPCDPEFQVGGASLVHLPDGRWRMYYQARQAGPPSPPNCTPTAFQIYSAISSDGITFTREGVRIAAHSQDHSSALGGAAHGRVLLLDDGTFAAIISGVATPGTPTSGIYLLTSSDGLSFGPPQQLPAPSNAHDPYVVKVGGRYVLYTDVSPPDSASAFMLTSLDGLNWSAGSPATFVDSSGAALVFHTDPFAPLPDPRHDIGDIGGVVLHDGSLRLYSNWEGNIVEYQRSDGSPVPNYDGLWWAAPAGAESGWGITFAHQGDIIFAAWFTYDLTGKGLWLVMTAQKTAPNTYTGMLYTTTGPAFNAVPFDPRQVVPTDVGTGTITFSDNSNGSFIYTVNGVSQMKNITREVFGPLPTCIFGIGGLGTATNYQDLWWASPPGSESGWGIFFTHQGDTIFATWFTYDLDHTPMWLVATAAKTAVGVYSGTLYRTTGPAFNAAPFNPANVAATAVGTATFTFMDTFNAPLTMARFDYTVNGISQTKTITREVFENPGTLCQ